MPTGPGAVMRHAREAVLKWSRVTRIKQTFLDPKMRLSDSREINRRGLNANGASIVNADGA
jgi:hypothetical protein